MHGPLAQLAEQQTLNLRVKGSIPLRLKKGGMAALFFFNEVFFFHHEKHGNKESDGSRPMHLHARVVELVDTPVLGAGASA